MTTYIILSRFSPEAFDNPKHFLELAEQVSKKIKQECPNVKWKDSYATLGRYDVIDVVEASDSKEIEKSHDYPGLRTLDNGNANWYTLERISRGVEIVDR